MPNISLKQLVAWISRHELWPTAVGVLLATLSLRFAPWGLAILAALWLSRRLGTGHWSISTPVDWPVGVLVVMGGVAWLVTVDRAATALALSRLLAGLALMYGIVNWAKTSARLLLILWGTTMCALLLAVATPMVIPWQRAGYIPAVATRIPHLGNLNPNMVAGALVMLVPFPLAIVLHPGRSLWRALGACVSLLVLGALALTKSRGAWLAAITATCIMGASHSLRLMWLLPTLLLLASASIWPGQILAALTVSPQGGTIAGWNLRVEIWRRAYHIILTRPLTGYGADTYQHIARIFFPANSPASPMPHAHNLYLQAALDVGVPGLISFLVLVARTVQHSTRALHGYPLDTVLRSAAWVGCASLTAMLVHGLVDATTWIVGWGAPLPWLVIGLLLAVVYQARQIAHSQEIIADVFAL